MLSRLKGVCRYYFVALLSALYQLETPRTASKGSFMLCFAAHYQRLTDKDTHDKEAKSTAP
jgi:hypothetical protein